MEADLGAPAIPSFENAFVRVVGDRSCDHENATQSQAAREQAPLFQMPSERLTVKHRVGFMRNKLQVSGFKVLAAALV